MAQQVQLRRGTAAEWVAANPILAIGELGFETDTSKYKIGDGSTAWNSKGYSVLSSGSFTNTTFSGSSLESVFTTGTGFAGYTYYVTTNGAIQYSTANATSNGTVNISSTSGQTLNALMTTGQAVTIVLLITNGGTAYYPTAWQVDGSAVTPKWFGGTAPGTGNVNSVDAYTATIIKTGNAAFTILASQIKYA